MKKLFSIAFALALVLTVLAGCQTSLSAPQPPAEPPANVVPLDAPVEPLPPATPAQAATKLTADQALEIAAEHERYVTALINAIYHEAHEAKDYRTMKFLDWFVDEQMEEEDNADSMVSRYKLFGGDARGLYLLDQEYAARVYAPPSLTL